MVDARTGYDAYELYLGIKLHFNSDYDYIKYNGKVNTNFDAFLKRKDKFHFAKLGRVYDKELKDFFVSNFIYEDSWIGDLMDGTADTNFKNYKKYIQSLSYSFEKDQEFLKTQCGGIDDLFHADSTSHPTIVKCILSRSIHPITYALTERKLSFSDTLSIDEEYVWPEVKLRMKKLVPFVPYDVVKITDIMRKVWT